MPIPKPSKNQSKDEFVEECMSDETMKRDYERKKRLAICLSKWKREK